MTPFPPVPLCHIITPIGMLGFGFKEDELISTLKSLSTSAAPRAIILDSGSTDAGPQKLANGRSNTPRSSYVRDLDKLLRAVKTFKVPLLIGSAGGGTDERVDMIADIVRDIAHETEQQLKTIRIYSNIDKSLVTERLKQGVIRGCGSAVPPLLQDDIDDAKVIIAQMGPEPYLHAIAQHPDFDVILAGRTYDPAPYFAFATSCFRAAYSDYSFDTSFMDEFNGGIAHMGKIMECGALCATPKSAGAVATVYDDGTFDIVPMDPDAKCTPLSVAAHTLYEKSQPDILRGPGGWLDLTGAAYEQLGDGRTVRVCGGIFRGSVENGMSYQIKLEGARNRGYRAIWMGCIKEPILVRQIDDFLPYTKTYVRMQHPDLRDDGSWDIDWHIYGRDTQEIFLIGEAIAPTQELARSIASAARKATIHGPYKGQRGTSGSNLAFGIGAAAEIELGPCADFCIYHLMDLEPGEELSLFPMEYGLMGTDLSAALVSHATEADVPEPKTVFHVRNTSDAPTAVLQAAQRMIEAERETREPPRTLGDIANLLRSKNAGPYEITLDVMFDDAKTFTAIKASNMLSRELIADLYDLAPHQVIWCGFFDQALAFKATIPRMRNGKPRPSGGYMENDVHGSQMYMPLLDLELPESVRSVVEDSYRPRSSTSTFH